jgi:hypothetical protein
LKGWWSQKAVGSQKVESGACTCLLMAVALTQCCQRPVIPHPHTQRSEVQHLCQESNSTSSLRVGRMGSLLGIFSL